MKKIKVLALLGMAFFATSAINAQVSVGLNIGLPNVVVSGNYNGGYAPQRTVVREYYDTPVVYHSSNVYDNRRDHNRRRYIAQRRYEDQRRYEVRRYEVRRYEGRRYEGRGYEGRRHENRGHGDRR